MHLALAKLLRQGRGPTQMEGWGAMSIGSRPVQLPYVPAGTLLLAHIYAYRDVHVKCKPERLILPVESKADFRRVIAGGGVQARARPSYACGRTPTCSQDETGGRLPKARFAVA